MYHSTYKGINIYRSTEVGYKLRWTTVTPKLAADTLAGIKKLIRQAIEDHAVDHGISYRNSM